MTLLTDYAQNINSQFGEDGIIRECFTRMDCLHGGRAIEVGASDGREVSNTLWLRDIVGWRRILLEADETLFSRIEEHEQDSAVHVAIEPTGPFSLDELVTDIEIDFLSLDIDGDDYGVLKHLQMRPKLIVAEFNQTMPWHLNVASSAIGCSLRAMVELMAVKHYSFIGATHCNAFFVRSELLIHFADIERNPELYLDPANFTYLVTSLYGGAVAFGPQIFGVTRRFAGELDVIDANGGVQTVRLTSRSVRSNW